MATAPMLSPQVLGQAENAHRAILDRILSGTGHTYQHWVALTLTADGTAIDRDQLAERMAGALKISVPAAQAVTARLIAARLLQTLADGSRIKITSAGEALHQQVRSAINEVMGRVYGGIPAGDLATAGRVLALLTSRANAELGAA